MVGCDGAHSVVRQQLKIPFEGAEYHASFLLGDVDTNNKLPADEMQLCPSEFGPVAIFPMNSARRRIVATIKNPEGDAPSLELVQKILAQSAPNAIEADGLHWSSYFRIHHRRVARLCEGRMFIAGDAAHIHSLFGGQGMNTGLHDVWNLVGELALFLRGRGSRCYSTVTAAIVSGHTDHVWCVAWKSHGSWLSTASWDGSAKVWDTATGKPLLTLSGVNARLSSVAWSQDDRRLATASEEHLARLV